jgi:hypothetical protein
MPGIPADIVPATFKSSKRTAAKTEAGEEGEEKVGRYEADAEGDKPTASLGRGKR